MEFAKYHSPVHPDPQYDRSRPRIGTLVVVHDFDGSDCNFYPNHEVFGRCTKGEYPLYGEFEFRRDERTYRPIGVAYMKDAYAHIPGTSYDGKVGFHHPFHIYGYEVGEYLGDGKETRNTIFRIVLDAPFSFDGGKRDVVGYDMQWLELSKEEIENGR